MTILRIRDLTPEEAKKVDAKARPDGARPTYYNASTGTLVEISSDCEAWLILTPSTIKARLANFFSLISQSTLNTWSKRQDLLIAWATNEIKDLKGNIEAFGEIADTYDAIRKDLSDYTTGFESVEEINKIINDLTTVVGDYINRRDSLQFLKTINIILKARASNTSDEVKREIQSWVKVLLEYQEN
jgi:hypothetical protein